MPSAVAAGCCCLSNNVRHIVLALTLAVCSSLFSNAILFNLTSLSHPDLHPSLKTTSQADRLLPDDEDTESRFRRAVNDSEWEEAGATERLRDLPLPTPTDDAAMKILKGERPGHPILPKGYTDETAPPTTHTTTTTKRTTPKVVFITNPTTPPSTKRPTTPSTKAPTTEHWSIPLWNDVNPSPSGDKFAVFDKDTLPTKGGEVEEKSPEQPSQIPQPMEKEQKQVRHSSSSSSALSPIVRSLVYAAPGIGCLIGTMPVMLFIKSHGCRYLIPILLLVSGIATAVLPLVVEWGFFVVFSLRLLTGVCFAGALPLIGQVTASWGGLREQLTFIATAFLFIAFGPLSSWPFSMALVHLEIPREMIYLSHAAVSALLALVFIVFYRDRPQQHPWMAGLELNRIVAGKVQELKQNRALSTPCSTLLRSVSAWAIWTSLFGMFCAVSLIAVFFPTLCTHMDVFLVDQLGVSASQPFILIPLTMLGSAVGMSCCCTSNTTLAVRIWNTVSLVWTAAMLIVTALMFLAGNAESSLLFVPLTLAPLGLSAAGCLRSVTLVGRYFAQHLIGYASFAAGAALTLIPFIVIHMVQENSLVEWTRAFLLTAGIVTVCAVVFAIFGRGRSAGWAESSWDPLVSSKMRTLDPIDMSADECGLYEIRLIGPNK